MPALQGVVEDVVALDGDALLEGDFDHNLKMAGDFAVGGAEMGGQFLRAAGLGQPFGGGEGVG